MPTAAVDYRIVLPGDCHLVVTSPEGVITEDVVYPMPQVSVGVRKRPASTTHPRRPDKTRAPGDWYHHGARIEGPEGSVTSIRPGGEQRTYTGELASYVDESGFLPPNGGLDDMLAQCRLKALSTFTERQAQFNTALRESGDIAKMAHQFSKKALTGLDDMMGHSGEEILNWVTSEKKLGRYADVASKRAFDSIPSSYLQYCYGLAPLGDDMANAVNVLSDRFDRGYEMALTLKARQKSARVIDFGFTGNTGAGSCPPNGGWLQGFRALETSHVAVSYVYQLPSWWKDELPVVAPFSSEWQHAPYTFVLDWVLPIGQWLGAAEAAQLSPFFKEGSESSIVRRRIISTSLRSEGINTIIPSGNPTFRGSSFRMRRSAVGSAPSALTTPPQLRKSLGVNQVSQGLSLLTQAFQRWFR